MKDKHSSKNVKRILCVLMSLVLVCVSVMSTAYAADNSNGTTSGTYSYTSNEGSNIQIKDEFTWRDDCFTRSSFLGCGHLRLLSTQAAIASASRYGDSQDKYEQDPSNNAQRTNKDT